MLRLQIVRKTADLLDVHVNCIDSMLPHRTAMRAKATNANLNTKKNDRAFLELYMRVNMEPQTYRTSIYLHGNTIEQPTSDNQLRTELKVCPAKHQETP